MGDYIDRGLESKEVVDMVIRSQLKEFNQINLIGNHEEAMLSFLDDPISGAEWLEFGGDATLLSYGVQSTPGVWNADKLLEACRTLKERLPQTHFQFLKELRNEFSLGDYMFVHAGVSPDRPLTNQDQNDLRWIREPFVSHKRLYEKIIVHGHTITDDAEFHANRIAIDTGAYYSGRLTCLVLEENTRKILRTDN